MKRRLSYELQTIVMKNAVFLFCILLSVSTLCIADSPADEEQVSTTVSVSLVAKKISTTTRIHRSANTTKETSPADVIPVSITEMSVIEKPSTTFIDDLGKFQKLKKKVLASNLRNESERFVLSSDDRNEKPSILHTMINVTKSYAKLKEGNVESFLMKSEKTTEVSEIQMNRTMIGDSRKKKDGTLEGRSLENGSSHQNTTINFRKKLRISPGVTEQSTKGYGFEELQKLVTNNQVYRQEAHVRPDVGIIRPSPTMKVPSRKLRPVSLDNTHRNAIRFESSTGQTDWMPIIPERLSMELMSTMPHEFTKLKPVTPERLNNERQLIALPSEGKLQKDSNVIPIRDVEITRTTERHKNNVEKLSGDGVKLPTQDAAKLPVKFRGAVKYKSSAFNGTTGNFRKFHDESNHNKSHGIENSAMEIPVTGASWTLATLKGPNSMKTTEHQTSSASVLNITNQTQKSELVFDGGLIVPPENVKIENITKEPNVLLSTSKVMVPGILSSFTNEPSLRQSTSTPLQLLETWTSMKIVKSEQTENETRVDIPGSVDISQSTESTPFLEIMKVSTPEVETTSIDITTTENAVASESPQELITVSKTFKDSSENTDILETTSQNLTDEHVENFSERVSSEASSEEVTTSLWPSTLDSVTVSPIIKSSLPEETKKEGETHTKVEPILFSQENNGNASDINVKGRSEIRGHLTGFNVTTDISGRNVLESSVAVVTPAEDDVVYGSTMYTIFETTTSSYENERTMAKTTANTFKSSFNLSAVETNKTDSITLPNVTITSARTASNVSIPEITTEYFLTSFIQPINPIEDATTLLTTTTFTTPRSTPQSSLNESLPAPFTTTDSDVKELSPVAGPTTTTATYKLIGKSEVTDESIYYKNYIPTTVNFRDEITEENVPAYLRLTVQTASWMELCSLREPLREAIIKMLSEENVTSEAVHFLNLSDRNCQEKIEKTKEIPRNGTIFLPVNMFLMDQNRNFDKNLSEAFLTIWGRQGLDFDLPIRKVDFVTPIVNLTGLYEHPLGGSVVAAIVISCVAGICVILLGILFVIMKRRQKRFNYGQRCTPVSLDAYSLDSVSIYNSVRRKGMRASKRSYGNAAFDDSEVPSHPMNFAGLANFSSGREQLYEEFNVIPQVYPKVEELPEKAETKNRYANVIPIPETRVHLSVIDGDPLSDYINANYVRGNTGTEKLYIACQAPMESTIKDFWRMIWEQQCKVILMLTDLQENGIEKCADYLPPNEVTDNLRLFGDYQVTLKKRDVKDKYIVSNLTLKNMEANLWREVTHLWYLGWPDQGIPSEANSLIAFLIEARSQMKTHNAATTPPAVVHCSPGTGRTGTVIACDLCIREYEQNRMVDIPKCVFNLRRDRAGAVQTKDQYAFIYQVLHVYATKLSGGGIESI